MEHGSRFHACFFCVEVEVNGAEHIAVIGDGAGMHAECFREIEEAVGPDSAVKKAILRMNVEMNEVFHGSSFPFDGAWGFR